MKSIIILVSILLAFTSSANAATKLTADKAVIQLITDLYGSVNRYADDCESSAVFDVESQALTVQISVENNKVELKLSSLASGEYILTRNDIDNGYYELVYQTPQGNMLKIFSGEDAMAGIEIEKTEDGKTKKLRCEIWF